ncbi:MAG: hypothetical protein DMG68_12830 [Acidobacteria bacterium]|nr:MAG: hypothetical protein DMG68_12830 [Acidobacteriota bacterium]
MTRNLVVLICCLVIHAGTTAQDAPANPHPATKVEVDNQQVRVVRKYHAPREKVPMHSHPDSVVVYLTEVREISTDPDGKSREVTHHAGDVIWSPAHTHSLENLADTPIEVVEIELKSPPTAGLHSRSKQTSHKLVAHALNSAK